MKQYVESKGQVQVADEQERETVLSEVADAIWFFDGPPEIRAEGLELQVEPKDDVDGVIEFLFLRRYGDAWDVSARAEWQRSNGREAAE